MNLFDLFAAAHQGAQLSPGQRALLKFLQSLFIGALLAALLAAAQYLAAPGQINWTTLGIVALTAGVLSIAHGIAKFITAQGDVYLPLGNAIEQIIQEIERRYHLAPPASPPPATGTGESPSPASQESGATSTLPPIRLVDPGQIPPQDR